ncbi:hypothetical protein ACHAW6_001253 [Cyclotella cf. meneghiniana]
MPCNLYSDTLFCPKVPSAQGYMMAQIFVTDVGWSQSYPMSHKNQANDALGLLFAWEGVLPKMIVDGAKETKLGEFAWKCKEAMCYLHGTEPYSPWSNFTECEIRELKKGAARKLTRSRAPRWLWCFVMEYKSYVHLHTAHDIYQLDGHDPKTPILEFGFWDWVKFREDGVAYPDNQMVLGKYLGPSIDVGPAMMQWSSLVRLQTLAHSVNLAFGIGSSLGRTLSPLLATKWYLASTSALVLTWCLQ